MNPFVEQIQESIGEYGLLQPGQKVLLAVSGGVDSMVLLSVLHRLSGAFDWKLHVAHFNHQLRGRSGDADERLVRRVSQSLNLPISIESADVRKFAYTQKISIEMAARQLRHEFLARVAREQNIQTVALAHHADDQVELFFVRLLRGSGPDGLCGMSLAAPSPADANLVLIRPLLERTKEQILAYARAGKIEFREDRTNQSLDMVRNRIRHELIPVLQKHYQPAIQKTTLRLMEILRAESDFLNSALEPGAFSNMAVALQRRLLHQQLIDLGLQPNFELIEELRRNPDAVVMVQSDTIVKRDLSGHLKLERLSRSSFDGEALLVSLSNSSGAFCFGGVQVDWRIDLVPKRSSKLPKAVSGMESFDADKVGPSILLRHWQPGDRFQPIGMSKPVKLQDLFVNQKVLRAERHKLLVAASPAGDIVWVEGIRIAERFKLDSHSQRRLKWCWRRP